MEQITIFDVLNRQEKEAEIDFNKQVYVFQQELSKAFDYKVDKK